MNFPGLEDLEDNSTNAKTNSGVSLLSEENPKIMEHPLENFESYMAKKDLILTKAKRVSSKNVLVEAPVNLVLWKIYKPSFFKM